MRAPTKVFLDLADTARRRDTRQRRPRRADAPQALPNRRTIAPYRCRSGSRHL